MKTYTLAALIVIGLLAAYVLSIGPAMWWMARSPSQSVAVEKLGKIRLIYAPLIWVGSKSRPMEKAIVWYNARWTPDVVWSPSYPPPAGGLSLFGGR